MNNADIIPYHVVIKMSKNNYKASFCLLHTNLKRDQT